MSVLFFLHLHSSLSLLFVLHLQNCLFNVRPSPTKLLSLMFVLQLVSALLAVTHSRLFVPHFHHHPDIKPSFSCSFPTAPQPSPPPPRPAPPPSRPVTLFHLLLHSPLCLSSSSAFFFFSFTPHLSGFSLSLCVCVPLLSLIHISEPTRRS